MGYVYEIRTNKVKIDLYNSVSNQDNNSFSYSGYNSDSDAFWCRCIFKKQFILNVDWWIE
jgi:hypothetical protein